MAVTYGARDSLGVHLAMMVIVGAPLAIASLMHLYPNALLNAVVFVPTQKPAAKTGRLAKMRREATSRSLVYEENI